MGSCACLSPRPSVRLAQILERLTQVFFRRFRSSDRDVSSWVALVSLCQCTERRRPHILAALSPRSQVVGLALFSKSEQLTEENRRCPRGVTLGATQPPNRTPNSDGCEPPQPQQYPYKISVFSNLSGARKQRPRRPATICIWKLSPAQRVRLGLP